MNQELKDKWVSALRSGKYRQGKSVLRSGDKFCCLGVLCDLVNPSCWVTDQIYDIDRYYYKYNNAEASCSLPSELLKQVTSDIEENKLIQMNDAGASFSQIADYIEENL